MLRIVVDQAQPGFVDELVEPGPFGQRWQRGEPGPDPVADLVRRDRLDPPTPLSASASASVAGRSRRYSSPDPDRTASWASAAASRSSRPSLSATGEAPGLRRRELQLSCSRCAARAAGTSGSPAARACGDQMVSRAAERFRRVEQGRVGRQQGDPAVAAASGRSAHRPRRPGSAPGPGPGPGAASPAAIRAAGTESRRQREAARRGPPRRVRRRWRRRPGPPGPAGRCPRRRRAGRGTPAWAAQPSCRAPTCWATRALVTASSPAHLVLAGERVEAGFQAQQQAGRGAARRRTGRPGVGQRAAPPPRPDRAGPRPGWPLGRLVSWPRPVTASTELVPPLPGPGLDLPAGRLGHPGEPVQPDRIDGDEVGDGDHPVGLQRRQRAGGKARHRPAGSTARPRRRVRRRRRGWSGAPGRTPTARRPASPRRCRTVPWRCAPARCGRTPRAVPATARSNMRASMVASSWTDAGRTARPRTSGVAPVAISKSTTAAEYRSAAESCRPRSGASRNGSR